MKVRTMMQQNIKNIVKYYIFCGLFQTIWSLAVIAFNIFLLEFFRTPYTLFALGLIFMKPFISLKYSEHTGDTDLK